MAKYFTVKYISTDGNISVSEYVYITDTLYEDQLFMCGGGYNSKILSVGGYGISCTRNLSNGVM